MSTHLLQTRLIELRAAVRQFLALEGLAAIAIAVVVAVAVTFALDWLLRLTQAQRALIGGLALVGVGVVVWRWLVRPLLRHLPDREMALVLEKCFPQLEDRFITAVELTGQSTSAARLRVSEQLLAEVVRQAGEAARRLSPAESLDRGQLRRWLATATAAIATVVLAWGIFPTTMHVWLQRNVLLRAVEWPQATYLTVIGFGDKPVRVMRGGTLEIVIDARGRKIPDSVRLDMQFASSGRFHEEIARAAIADSSTGSGQRFVRRLEGVVEPFRFWVSGGDATTPQYAVELVEPPVLSDVKFRAIYPEYTGLSSRIFGLGEGNLEVPIGTTLELTATSSKLLKGGRMFYGDKELGAVSLMPLGRKVVTAEKSQILARLKVMYSGRLRLALDDLEGFTSDTAFMYPVFALPDRVPVLRLQVAGVGERVTKMATVPLSVEARDDYGVTAMELQFSKSDLSRGADARDLATGQSHTMPFKDITLPSRLARFNFIWPLEPIGLTEGDTLFFRLVARDAAAIPTEGNRAESTMLALRVVSAAELLEDLTRRQKAFRIEFERLTNRQREVVDATKLLRDRIASGQLSSAFREGSGSPAAIVADERDIGNGSQNLSEQFARVLTEMRNNHISTGSDYQRLELRIVGPLRDVARTLLDDVSITMERLDMEGAPEVVLSMLETQVEEQSRVHERMIAILADMVKGETLADAIAFLRDILNSQQTLSETTKKRLEEEINRLLGGTNR